MHVSRLSLNHFRPFIRQEFELSQGLNIFHGSNAQGKTSILEAIFLCSVGASFRTHLLNELIHRQTPGFTVELAYEKCGITQDIKVRGTSQEKYVLLNGSKQPLGSLYGGLTAVASTPDDVQLIKGPPSLRRDYLDQQLLQVDPLYNHHLKRYGRALKQRNTLLKHHSHQTLESWEFELSHSAAYLMTRRKTALEALLPHTCKLYQRLSGTQSEIVLKYKSGIAAETIDQLRATWRSQRERDMHVGTTLSGPHKDDIQIVLNQLELRHFGSEGEQRTAALALRLAEWNLILEAGEEEKPILLVDDIGYGLDSLRRKNLLDWLSEAGQVLLTTTDRMEGGKLFEIKSS